MKLPAFQFYPGDWRKDPGVQALDFFARGVWFEILCLMHEAEPRGYLMLNGKPMPEEALASLLGLQLDLLKQNLSKIEAYGVASRDQNTGSLICRRMVRDEHIRQVRAEAGKKGGNPNLLKQKSSKHEAKQNQTGNQNTTPSTSSSFSSSDTKYNAKASEDWFLKKFNEITGKNHTKLPDKAKKALKARVVTDGYTSADFITAIQNCMSDKYHRENNLKYLTPEFITRGDKLEMYLAKASGTQQPKEGTVDNPKTTNTMREHLQTYGEINEEEFAKEYSQ